MVHILAALFPLQQLQPTVITANQSQRGRVTGAVLERKAPRTWEWPRVCEGFLDFAECSGSET